MFEVCADPTSSFKMVSLLPSVLAKTPALRVSGGGGESPVTSQTAHGTGPRRWWDTPAHSPAASLSLGLPLTSTR